MRSTIICLLTLIAYTASAQGIYQMASLSDVTIYGTSNVHDWSEHCEKIQGSVRVMEEEGTLKMSDLNFKVEVSHIKSGKSTMDEYTYEALEKNSHPTIAFKAKMVGVEQKASTYLIQAKGTMTIAGQSRPEMVLAVCKRNPHGFMCSGEKSIDMTDFGVEPPSVMFGAMTVGKDVDVKFEIQITPNHTAF